MMAFDLAGLGPGSPPGDSTARVPQLLTGEPTRFESILFERPGAGPDPGGLVEPAFFADLNLDQVVRSMTAGREQYDLRPLFYAPLHDADAVWYRHEVLRDLDNRELLKLVSTFSEAMRRMREHLGHSQRLRHQLQKQAWFLDATEIYCKAVRALARDLTRCDLTSRGFRRFRDYLVEYAGSGRFTSLETQAAELKGALAGIRYAIRILGPRVTVSRYDGEPDYGAEVTETFAKFQQGEVRSFLVSLPETADMDHVEAQIAELVAKLYPDVFTPLAEYCAGHRDYLDQTIGRFEREVQFYLAYLELADRLRAAGLPFCYPNLSARPTQLDVRDTFDIALADQRALGGSSVITNDYRLEGPERVFVVSGPNNGGKTTFARAFGQLYYLASLGVLVPGRSAQLTLPDRIFTHFEKEENITTLRGKLEDELVRVRQILDQATEDSVIVMNESFSATSLTDAIFVGTEVMRRILDLGCLGVYVTFIDEITSLSEATVSMVSQIVPGNPAERTFKVIRQPADGLAYAWALAQKYGLTYQRLMERIG